MPTDKSIIHQRKEEILELLRAFSTAKLNEEYFELTEKVLNKLARKRHVPFETGRVEIWAAAIIHAIGMLNFLFDKTQNPHIEASEIHDFFDTKETTVGNKSREIRTMLKLRQWDSEFSTQKMLQNNPYSRYAMIGRFIQSLD